MNETSAVGKPVVTVGRWFLSGRSHDDAPVQQVCIDTSPFQVGRRPGLSLRLPCQTVSGLHAAFLLRPGKLFIQDLGSTNGTFVNGVRVQGECEVNDGDLIQFAEAVFRVCRQAAVADSRTIQGDADDLALSLIQFDRLIEGRNIIPFFQPIVSLGDEKKVIGYEILARSQLYGLSEPKAMFHAAAVLELEDELSRICREEGVRVGSRLPGSPLLFVNTHPAELQDDEKLLYSMRELREAYPSQPVVLEIHEAAASNPTQMRKIKAALTELDMSLAYDDFGAGQARLVELIDVPPTYLKFDLKFTRDIENAPQQRHKMLQDFIRMVRDAGVLALAEGIETGEADVTCQEIGFELGQGYYYGRPANVDTYLPQANEGENSAG